MSGPSPSPTLITETLPPPRTDFISAKSRLIKLGSKIVSVIPFTALATISSATMNALSIARFGTYSTSLLLSITTTVSATLLNLSIPSRAFSSLERSILNGNVTIATTIAPASFAISAMTGTEPVPVPPPIPAVRNMRCTPFRRLAISCLLASAAFSPISGKPPAPSPRVSLDPIRIFVIPSSIFFRSWASVLQASSSTPAVTPILESLFIVLLPPPPVPRTAILSLSAPVNSSSDFFSSDTAPYLIASLTIESIFCINCLIIIFIYCVSLRPSHRPQACRYKPFQYPSHLRLID